MKLLYRLLFFIALCWGFSNPSAQATHILGADLTWSCNQQNTCLYTFTYRKYIECPYSASDPAPPLNLVCNDPGSNQSISAVNFALQPPIVEITPLCAGAASDCNGGTVPGVVRLLFTQTVDLCSSTFCTSWDVDWAICCRSNQITSINNPTNTRIASTSRLSFNPIDCNSSPVFATHPILNICNGQNSNFAQGATDPDGDQLVYSLQACQDQNNQTVNYAAGFSGMNPLGPNWNVAIDANTGNLSFTNISPSTAVAVVCVRVSEIRNGQVIGWVVRDIQVRVINCNGNNLPTLTGVDGNSDYTTKACVGALYCFSVNSFDADAGDNLTISLVSGPTGMALGTVGSPHPVGTVCWVPTVDDIGTNTLILEVRDDNCPNPGLQQYTYTIEVGVCNPCDTVSVDVDWTYSQNLLDVTVTNNSTGPAISNTEFIWGDGSPNQLFAGNWTSPVNHTFPAAGIYNVCVKTYTYVDDVLCTDSLCKEVKVYDNGCDPHTSSWTAVPDLYSPCTFHFYDTSSPTSSQVWWNFGTGGPIAFGSPVTHTFPGSGNYTITMTTLYTSPNGPSWFCTDTYISNFSAGCTIKDEGSSGRLHGGSGSIAWNQSNSSLRVILPQTDTPGASSVSIYDLSGKLLMKKEDISGPEVTFDLSGVAAGIYLVRTLSGGQMETRKFARP